MRELYEQTIAYWRAFAETLDTYQQADDYLVAVSNGFGATLNWICAGIAYGSAAARAPLTTGGVAPLSISPVGDLSSPERFLENSSPVCPKWSTMIADYRAATAEWINSVNPNVPAGQWPAQQQQLFNGVLTVLSSNAGQVQSLGLESANLIWRDFADLASQYRLAYVQAIPSYIPADNYLDSAATELIVAVDAACKASGG